jgi:hypothetical protein
MDGRQNWSQDPTYGDRRYDGSYYPRDPPYQTSAPGYDFNRVSGDPMYANQPPYGAGPYGEYPYGPEIDDEGARGTATASMVIGIISLSLCLIGLALYYICFIPMILSIIGLILSTNSLRRYKETGATEGKGMATAGMVMNIIGLSLGFLGTILTAIILMFVFSMPV